jgi:ankyrin repeat protein
MAMRSSILDRVTIPEPCDADWEAMTGNDEVRFCEHCRLHVHNLSTMTRRDAMRFVTESQGRVCLRFIQRPDGGPLTTGMPEKLYRISRRVSRLAAGAFTATLSLSSAAAQTNSTSDSCRVRTAAEVMQAGYASQATIDDFGASVSGIVRSQEGGPIADAIVMLVDPETGEERTATSSSIGGYSFDFVPHGEYLFWVRKPRFVTFTETVRISSNDTVRQDAELTPRSREVMILGGAMAMVITPEDPLLKAIQEGNIEATRTLVLENAAINRPSPRSHSSYLSEAVQRGNREIVSLLLAAGADPNVREPGGRTALMALSENATVDLARDLIAAGARINARDQVGANALMNIAPFGTVELVREMINAGSQLNATDSAGASVLFGAANNQDPEVLTFLLAAGLDPNIRDENGDTVLMSIAAHGRFTNFKALIDRGANLDVVNDEGMTILMMGVLNEDARFMKLLLEKGANVNAQDASGRTALANAAESGRLESTALLIRAGADPNVKDEYGDTPIMSAVRSGCAECVELLVRAGADLLVKNKEGKTALTIARNEAADEMIKLLERVGARD